MPADDGIIRPPKCVVVDDQFDWQGDRHLRRELSETVIYEMHVRGFTRGALERRRAPGHVPGRDRKDSVSEVAGRDGGRADAGPRVSDQRLLGRAASARPNYWGYDSLAFFSPHRGYAAGSEPGCQVNEFKQMVRALHQAGIEVILDVVFNHTAEGNELGPTLSFKGLENQVYYMLDDGGSYYKNYSGCGNTVNGNHPIVREMIFLCLRHWVHNYHVDGFRFDLASILSRDRNGELVPNPPVVEAIAEDPLLADTKIIAEAWDAAGAYQVGSFAQLALGRMERPLSRRRAPLLARRPGHDAAVGHAAGRLERSVSGRRPAAVSQHQLRHLARRLHAQRPGQLHARSTTRPTAKAIATATTTTTAATTASKGPTRRPEIEALAAAADQEHAGHAVAQPGRADAARPATNAAARSAATTTPIARTTRSRGSIGSWWRRTRTWCGSARSLIEFRRTQPTVRRIEFLSGEPARPGELPDVLWFGPDGRRKNWSADSPSLTCFFAAPRDRVGHPPLATCC